MAVITQEELNTSTIIYTNEHDPSAEAFSLELDFEQISTWDNPFKMFVNGELAATFRTLNGLRRRAQAIIAEHHLEKVEG